MRLLKELEDAISKNKSSGAWRFTNSFRDSSGKEYFYMSEVDPHTDSPLNEESFWTIRFYHVEPNYIFTYFFNNVQHSVVPVVGESYKFNFEMPHSYLSPENIRYKDVDDWEYEGIIDILHIVALNAFLL